LVDVAAVRRSFADAEPRPFWLSQPDAPAPGEPLQDELEADLVVVGGGLTGLWAALLAKEQDPRREVVLLEGERIAFGATGRNGGFVDASLTHGLDNGASRWPDEMPQLERLARENFTAIKEAMHRHGIDAGFEETGELFWTDHDGCPERAGSVTQAARAAAGKRTDGRSRSRWAGPTEGVGFEPTRDRDGP
jgi:glycine/D-amino acid oxidase-like deaminating enzyme